MAFLFFRGYGGINMKHADCCLNNMGISWSPAVMNPFPWQVYQVFLGDEITNDTGTIGRWCENYWEDGMKILWL